MKNKKIITFGLSTLAVGILSFGISSCFFNSKVTDKFGKEYQRESIHYYYNNENATSANEYVNVTAYFKDSEDICYVDVKTMALYLGDLYGLPFDIVCEGDSVKVSYDSFSGKEYLTINSKTNEVTVSSPNFYQYIGVNENVTSSKEFEITKDKYEIKPITYTLSDYSLEANVIDNKITLPLQVFNLIFCNSASYNFYYINHAIYGDVCNQNFSGISTSSPTSAQRELTYNFFKLFLGQYYGLSSYLGLNTVSEIETFLSLYKDNLLSTTTATFEQAELDILYKALNDPHTSLYTDSLGNSFYSIYHNSFSDVKPTYGTRMLKIKDALEEYTTKQKFSLSTSSYTPITFGKNSFFSRQSNTYGVIVDDTAYIFLKEFNLTEEKSESNIDSDTFSLMYYSLQFIDLYQKVNNKTIKNIVVDLTQNLGGVVVAGLELLSFMTNDPITWNYDFGNRNIFSSTSIKVDNNLDGNFNDNDAYTQYNWYIETSLCSFSCANLVPMIAKENGYAKIIGQTSGGGMCVVGSVTLPDGLRFNTSSISTRNITKAEKNNTTNFELNENGVTPDITLSPSLFYSYNFINYYLD